MLRASSASASSSAAASSACVQVVHAIFDRVFAALHLRVDDAGVLALAVDVVHFGVAAGIGERGVQDVVKIRCGKSHVRRERERERKRDRTGKNVQKAVVAGSRNLFLSIKYH